MEIPPPWAYGFNEPAPALSPTPAATPPAAIAPPKPPDSRLLSLPGTDRQFTSAEVKNNFGPGDWYPGDHPVMPEIVAHGRPPLVWACARCHYPNGKGRPENAPIAGQPVEYFIEQLQAFRNGERQSSDSRKSNTPLMISYAKAMTDAEMRAAAEYFGAIKWTPWIRVIETDRVPQTIPKGGMFLPVVGGADEPIGERLIEIPEDVAAVEDLRSPRVGFIAYVPKGSIKRGETLVTTGGGRTTLCAACHGPDFKGLILPETGAMPGLAGRSPSYLVRQMFDLKTGMRHGKRSELMKPVVASLSSADMLAIAAYLASLTP